eukprot:767951-Hanusia_phi.AAC.6
MPATLSSSILICEQSCCRCAAEGQYNDMTVKLQRNRNHLRAVMLSIEQPGSPRADKSPAAGDQNFGTQSASSSQCVFSARGLLSFVLSLQSCAACCHGEHCGQTRTPGPNMARCYWCWGGESRRHMGWSVQDGGVGRTVPNFWGSERKRVNLKTTVGYYDSGVRWADKG